MLFFVKKTPEYAIALHDADRKVIITVWYRDSAATDQTTFPEMLAEVSGMARRLTASSGQKTLVVSSAKKFADVPSGDAAKALTDTLQRDADVIEAWAVLVLDDTWRAKFIIAFVWAIAKISGYAVPHRPYTSYRDIARWFLLDYRVETAPLVASIETVLDTVLNKPQA